MASAVGQTNSRAISSQSGPATARTAGASDGASQFVIAPSASDAASRTMPGRSAARASPGGWAGGGSSRKPLMAKLSYPALTFSPASAARRKSSVSRARWYGRASSMPFHASTITGEEVPMPSTNRPGARAATVAAFIASRAGPRVKIPAMAVPSRSRSVHWAASASGVKASAPLTSADQASV